MSLTKISRNEKFDCKMEEDMYQAHESAQTYFSCLLPSDLLDEIRHTDFTAIKTAKMDAVTFNLFNAIEDWRVENRLAAIFPGCRQNLRWLVKHIFMEEDRDKNTNCAPKPKSVAALNYVLLTVRGWDVPELGDQIQTSRQILDVNFPGLGGDLDTILDRVRKSCPDSQTVIGYACELAQCIKDWESPEQQDNHQQQGEANNADSHATQYCPNNVQF